MGHVGDFKQELAKRSPGGHANWFPVDLHNHSPNSFDYTDKSPEALDAIVTVLSHKKPAVVMFTDHEQLPDRAFCEQLQRRTGVLILRGVEVNCFVDAYDKAGDTVGRTLYYHLLIGFDPEGTQTPEYWVEELYRECRAERRDVGAREVKGIPASAAEVAGVLKDAGAIIIPAHIHSEPKSWKTRSVDDIYADQQFLHDVARHFTAIEVTRESTAAFFDGTRQETGRLHKSCIWSSDAHEPARLGERMTYLLMERPCFQEVRAALELPIRTSLKRPAEPDCQILGIHVHGQFLPDTWLAFGSGCNVLIGGKGSGKTSILECLRFCVGAPVPASRQESVDKHLAAILGASGRVRVLAQRGDGATVLMERTITDKKFVLTFEDDRREVFSNPEALAFPTQILGWHEIEQIATDTTIRRQY